MLNLLDMVLCWLILVINFQEKTAGIVLLPPKIFISQVDVGHLKTKLFHYHLVIASVIRNLAPSLLTYQTTLVVLFMCDLERLNSLYFIICIDIIWCSVTELRIFLWCFGLFCVCFLSLCQWTVQWLRSTSADNQRKVSRILFPRLDTSIRVLKWRQNLLIWLSRLLSGGV